MPGKVRKGHRRPHLKSQLVRGLKKVRSNYVAATLIETVTDFCKETSIHGCRFIFEDIEEGHSYMRTIRRLIAIVTWLTFIFAGISLSIYLMLLLWHRFQKSPTYTSVETNNYPIWNVPFPGVTICNVNTVYKPNIENLTNELQSKGFSNRTIDLYFQSLSALITFNEIDREFLSIWQTLEDIGYTIEKIMFEIRQPCRNLLKQCIWLGKEMPCGNLFRVAKSSEGFCCSFNYKALKSELEIKCHRIANLILWITAVSLGVIFAIYLMYKAWNSYRTKPTIVTIETNNYPIWNVAFPGVTICNVNTVYKPKMNHFMKLFETKADDYDQINTPVIRISGAGENVGLAVLLDVEPNEYVAPKRFLYGAEIIIHDAEDFPEKSLLTAFGQPGLEVSIAVMPSVVITESSAKALPVNLRLCRFSYEKKLKITKKYSFQSCITECRAYTILQKCDCLPFFYPPLYYKNSSEQNRQCTLRDIKCLSDNKHVFASIEPPVSIKERMYNILNTTHIGMDCDCLPSCSEQIYNVQTFISKRFNQFKNNSMKFDNSTENINHPTLIKVYFKDLSCIKYRRELFMTWDNLLASFGGIFGLCLGGSVLSLVEIVYFAIFKFYAKYLHNKAEYKKHKKELEKLRSNPHYFNFNRRLFVPARQNQYKDLLW